MGQLSAGEADIGIYCSFLRPYGGKRQSRALWRRERTKRHPPPPNRPLYEPTEKVHNVNCINS